MNLASHLVLALSSVLMAPVQDATTPVVSAAEATRAVVEAATPEAREAWERLLSASRSDTEPIQSFALEAEVLTRDGVQSNEARISYRYLAPHFIRFNLSQDRETGRGPGLGQSAYWLRDREEVVVLEGRERTEDRRLIDQMAAVSRNFIALSDPARLRLSTLTRLEDVPTDLPASLERMGRKLDWMAIASADFALIDPASRTRRPSSTRPPIEYEVRLGLGKEGLPELALVRQLRAEGAKTPSAQPMLIRLASYREVDGFRVPYNLFVHRIEPRMSITDPVRFADKPGQEIFVTQADLRPELTEADFRP